MCESKLQGAAGAIQLLLAAGTCYSTALSMATPTIFFIKHACHSDALLVSLYVSLFILTNILYHLEWHTTHQQPFLSKISPTSR